MGEEQARNELGLVSRLTAEAVGVPGQRRFYLVVESGSTSANLWLEKEQLYQLAIYLQEIVATVSAEGARPGAEDDPSFEPPKAGPARIEFKVGKLALGHDSMSDRFLFIVHDAESDEDGPAALSFWSTRDQAEGLARRALEVCAAGRPVCPLCGQSMGPGPHVCPRSNGHSAFTA